ncbi:MAG TPA: DUF1634 domain-containing protein [Candidatus Kapabacteria bacterium]|jgi:uncharacterized membrane protein|nr:DUF1634 domain-containing protein [Candidatus Kapabacteria bacterium]
MRTHHVPANDTAKDHTIEVIIGNLLRICVILVVIIVGTGALLFLPSNASLMTSYRRFAGEPLALRSVKNILGLANSGDARGIMQAGLLLLILTPILRVVFSVFAFLYEKDYLYVLFTLVVLGILAFSLSGG